METNKDYHFSLFKPTSEYTRRVRNNIILMVTLWAAFVFGFQILLVVFQKPTPEKSLLAFESVREKVEAGTATSEENSVYIKSMAAVLGKSSLKKDKRAILSEEVTRNISGLLDSISLGKLTDDLKTFKSNNENLGKTATDESYLQIKATIEKSKDDILLQIKKVYGFEPKSLEANIVASNLTTAALQPKAKQNSAEINEIMKFYLTHNQSFLTNFKFLGFPFHYFYTAEFLLFLFVLLSLFYSIRIERLQKRFNIVE